jgi:hypothetical protein
MSKKVKILLISDKSNWAYASIARAIVKYNTDDSLEFSHVSCKGRYKKIRNMASAFDFYFVLGWQNYRSIGFLDRDRTLVGIHSHQSFDSKNRTTPESDFEPADKIIRHLSSFKAVNAVSKRLFRLFSKKGLKVSYTPNGVDTDLFCNDWDTRPKELIVSCAMAQKHDYNKGVTEIIKPACKKAGVKMISVSLEKGFVSHEKMPSFYRKSNCYVCASRSEGMSLSVLEAASCGCAIISTRCGDIPRLVVNGKNGFLIDRNIDSLYQCLSCLKDRPDELSDLNRNIRNSIVKDWDWSRNIGYWIRFIKENTQ